MTKINDKSRLVEITTTLESIAEVNEMLAFHRSFDEPDLNAIENFIRLRGDFFKQLSNLLDPFEVEIRMPMSAAA